MYQTINFTNRIVISAIVCLFLVGAARGATFTVNASGDFGDVNPGNGVCATFVGQCSFRAAIEEANALAGADTIAFGIFGGGVKTLSPASTYPDITDVVTIDGWTQGGAGYTGPPLIELVGTNAGALTIGLRITAGSSTVRGLAINRFDNDGIFLSTNGGNTIQGCYIGTDATGTVDLGNDGNGIQIFGSPNNLIGGSTAASRNIISGNDFGAGVLITQAAATGNVVKGNLIGTDVTGTAAIPNVSNGVAIEAGASSNVVGGDSPGERNVISGNAFYGVKIWDGSTSNKVIGNYIGTTANGNAALGNVNIGVSIHDSANNQIGGNTCGKRNIISGNLDDGVNIAGALSTGNSVANNIIGTNPDATIPLGNGDDGVTVHDGSDNRIGGGMGEGNIIAFNGGSGVLVVQDAGAPAGNSILRNSIYDNAGLGIELSVNWVLGVTPNDLDDPDAGANNLQNFPVISSAVNLGGVTNIAASLNSTPSTSFTIEFYSSPSCDSSGNGEGRLFLGSKNVATDANGDVTFNFSPAAPVALGQYITATATRSSAPFDTSEFSACVQVV